MSRNRPGKAERDVTRSLVQTILAGDHQKAREIALRIEDERRKRMIEWQHQQAEAQARRA